jgi:hypothetical protein
MYVKYELKKEVSSCNHCCCGKAIYITYSECVFVTLVVQHTKDMRRIALSFVACLVLPYFSTLSHKRYEFRKNYWIKNASFGFLYGFCPKYFSF